jgi:hypothetical protein
MKDRRIFLLFRLVFLAAYFIPFQQPTVQNAIGEAFALLQEYARQHVLFCLIPAFFIAGAVSVFVSKASVIKYFGAKAKKILSYSIASVSGMILAVLAWMIFAWFKKPELKEWTFSTWIFAKQIFPLLFAGVLVAGFLLGRPGHEGVIPSQWVARIVGGNSLGANLFASVAGAFMYFATLTEVPILQGLLGAGMGQGPALALLLAGPALSLPNMLVIRSILGTKKTLAYIILVVIMAKITGMIYGHFF